MALGENLGHNTQVSIDTPNFFANVTGVNWNGISRAEVDTTNYATTTARTNMPAALYDPGSLVVTFKFKPGTTPPIIAGDDPETCTVTFTDAAGTDWAATGFMSNLDINAAEEQAEYEGTATIRLSGPITI